MRSANDNDDNLFSFQWQEPLDVSLDEAIEGIQVQNPVWDAQRETIRRTHQAKLFLLGLLALLSVFVAMLSGHIRRQTQRWMRAKEEILQTVSHELKTPVASIRLMAETLERRLEGEERAKDYPSRIVRETDRMQHLTDNLLSFQRVQKGGWQVTKERVDLDELLQEVLLDVQSLRKDDDEIILDIPVGLELLADRELLHLTLRNLLKNALVYSSAPAKIEVVVEENAKEWSIWVKDDGPGIPKALHRTCFEAFERGSTEKSGTGLGLALVQSCMMLHQGSVRILPSTLASSAYKGAVFHLVFPKNHLTAPSEKNAS
ncbi:MAG: HAMP domain-containing histidine kinase [Deltaproteobacteria bacterium]|nr:HAMP domain-containing histidine kinase [Deltaproteobacteria bacterium]